MGQGKVLRQEYKLCLGLDPSPSLPQPANTSQHLLLSFSYWATVLELPWLAVMIFNSPRGDNLGIFKL